VYVLLCEYGSEYDGLSYRGGSNGAGDHGTELDRDMRLSNRGDTVPCKLGGGRFGGRFGGARRGGCSL